MMCSGPKLSNTPFGSVRRRSDVSNVWRALRLQTERQREIDLVDEHGILVDEDVRRVETVFRADAPVRVDDRGAARGSPCRRRGTSAARRARAAAAHGPRRRRTRTRRPCLSSTGYVFNRRRPMIVAATARGDRAQHAVGVSVREAVVPARDRALLVALDLARERDAAVHAPIREYRKPFRRCGSAECSRRAASREPVRSRRRSDPSSTGYQ